MAYQFTALSGATAIIYRQGSNDKFSMKGINGVQTNANNFHTAITGLLTVVGLQNSSKLERDITQEVEESP